MPGPRSSRRARSVLVITVLASLAAAIAPGAPVAAADRETQIVQIPPGSAYRQRNLVSDIPGMALVQDPLLVGPWGISKTAHGPLRLANGGTSTSTSYSRDVGGFPLVPGTGRISVAGGQPTGTVANAAATGFVVSSGGASGSARILFASETGNIVGWHPNVPAAGSTSGFIAASHPGRVYTGLAIGNDTANRLYAADFANGSVDAYGTNFALTTTTGNFADPTIPTTAGNTFHPFNVQNIAGSLYVTYARVGTDGRYEAGVGNGYVRRFNLDGVRDLTFGINNGALNAPWGVAIAPATFGIFGSALLVGNAGSGNPSIHAYNPSTGAFLGTIQNEGGVGIEIDELRALTFGNGVDGGSTDTLYFAAGTGEEGHGLLGSLVPTTVSATNTIQFGTDEFAIGEGAATIQITATRNGDASAPASVRYTTWDQSRPGHASQKRDYGLNAGVVRFAAGETSKTFTVQLVNDRFVEGAEIIDLALSNPSGAGVGLGSPNAAELKIIDNDTIPTTANPIDGTAFFVRMQYVDFLRREPDAGSLASWSKMIDDCGSNAACRARERNEVSWAFMSAKESLDTTGVIYRLHRAAFATDPLYGEVVLSAQVRRALGSGTMTDVFVANPRFVAIYASLSNAAYVNKLVTNSKVTFSTATKNAWIAKLNNGTSTRAGVLLNLASDPAFHTSVRSRWLVLSSFWAYLRRDPDASSLNARLSQLNAGGGNPLTSGLINSFVTSLEYRQRFGPS